jgi:hypothetical protein
MALPSGVVAFVKAECPTCTTVAPVLLELIEAGVPLTVYTQDDPAFPPGVPVTDDRELAISWAQGVETVPTLLKVEAGQVVRSLEGWRREDWEELTGVTGLGAGLPPYRPGCGSRTLDPGMPERLAASYGGDRLRARRLELGSQEDPVEAAYGRGWTDGLPIVPPTRERVLRMLEGTGRDPQDVVAVVPPDLVECTVEKVAVNAVLAGCLPEYLPVVLAALEAACTDEFNIHGLTATTWAGGPVVIVNGPIAERIGMNSGVNALGQGNRANATIGRALQLTVRNVGGGRPGEVDRSAQGSPGKYTFCFAEAEGGSPWEPLAATRDIAPGTSAVTLFAGAGVQPVVDQRSRTAESLVSSLAACLRTVGHPKLAQAWDALLIVSPEHGRVFGEAGWDRNRVEHELRDRLRLQRAQVVRGAGGIAEGLPDTSPEQIEKFRPGGLLLVHAGGTAGMFSAVVGGWVSGPAGSQPVTKEVEA